MDYFNSKSSHLVGSNIIRKTRNSRTLKTIPAWIRVWLQILIMCFCSNRLIQKFHASFYIVRVPMITIHIIVVGLRENYVTPVIWNNNHWILFIILLTVVGMYVITLVSNHLLIYLSLKYDAVFLLHILHVTSGFSV